jgi:hypothetical protein
MELNLQSKNPYKVWIFVRLHEHKSRMKCKLSKFISENIRLRASAHMSTKNINLENRKVKIKIKVRKNNINRIKPILTRGNFISILLITHY